MTKKKVVDFEDYYITTDGEVFSTRFDPPKQLSATPNTKGYPQVCMTKIVDGVRVQTTRSLHRMMKEAFMEYDENSTVNHIDKNKNNNKLNNLECISNADNMEHGQGFVYELVKKCGTKIVVKNLRKYAEDVLGKKSGHNNFQKLRKNIIKTCYGHTSCVKIGEVHNYTGEYDYV